MRRLHSRFHPVKLTNLKIGFEHIGIERQKSFFSSSVSSWWIPVEVEASEEHLHHQECRQSHHPSHNLLQHIHLLLSE